MTACDYPLFRERYFLGHDEVEKKASTSGSTVSSTRIGLRKPGATKPLKSLDLKSLPRDDGPPSELRARKDKLAFFDKDCTRIAEGLYVAGETVAKSRDLLRKSGITHIVNCVGFLYPPYFEDEINYKVLFLQDTPGEDILCVLYDVFDFIEDSRGGNVLVHCSQGVSRSTALAIAYLMWKTDRCYDDVFNEVKARRGVANPNIGFICQLLQWHKRRHTAAQPCRMFRMVPHSRAAPRYIVPKYLSTSSASSLDPRGAFVLQTESAVYVWKGTNSAEDFTIAASRFANQLKTYENAAGPVVSVNQGAECKDFWDHLLGAGHTAESASLQENSSYDKDFELFHQAISPSSGRTNGDTGDSPRSGRKTPRDDGANQSTSPNERLRKHAKNSDVSEDFRSLDDVSTEDIERGISVDSAAAELQVRGQRMERSTSSRLTRLQRTVSEEVCLPVDLQDEADVSSRGPAECSSAPKLSRKPILPSLNLKLPLKGLRGQ